MLRKTLIVLAVAISAVLTAHLASAEQGFPQGMTNGYSQSYGGRGYGGISRHGNCRRHLSC
jgi:hypothetical protein